MMNAKIVATGRTGEPEFSGEPAPLFKLSNLPKGVTAPAEIIGDGDVLELPDGGHAYAFSYPTDGTVGLYRYAVVTDYGGNEYARRSAPAPTDGIAAGFSVPLRHAQGDKLVGWLIG